MADTNSATDKPEPKDGAAPDPSGGSGSISKPPGIAAAGATGDGWNAPLSPLKRRQLHQCYMAAKNSEKHGTHDYAAKMYGQCVVGDPASLEYAQLFLNACRNMYPDLGKKKSGSMSLGGFFGGVPKEMKKAKLAKDWPTVVKVAVEQLKKNPLDAQVLIGLAEACQAYDALECELHYLKTALDTNPKDPELSRVCAHALARQGHFSQSIALWHRVEELKPNDQEALAQIGQLTAQQTMPRHQYEEKRREQQKAVQVHNAKASAAAKGQPAPEPEPEAVELSREQKMLAAIKANPADTVPYVDLADLYVVDARYEEAEKLLSDAISVSGGGKLEIRERYEDVQMLHWAQRVDIAAKRARQKPSDEALALLKRLRIEQNQVELAIYTARCDRTPGLPSIHYELGVRLKKIGKFEEAVKNLQKAHTDPKLRPFACLETGKCFAYLGQKKPAMNRLAMKDYVQAIDASRDREPEVYKDALYRAGVLAQDSGDLNAAEKYLTDLAGVDFGYKDVAERLDKIGESRNKG